MRAALSAAIALAVLTCGGNQQDAFDLNHEQRTEFCPVFSEVQAQRANDTLDDDTVDRLMDVVPGAFYDDVRLFFYPLGGPVYDLDASGIIATESGDRLKRLYENNC